MRIEHRPLDSITPYDNNPRVNDGAVEAVARSLKEYGWRQPVVVDKDNVIVVGHTRWKAARSLGMTEVPVHVAHELSPEQAKAYRIADNQTATIADWDMQLFPLELAELKDLGVDLSLLGFDDAELKALLSPPLVEGLTDPDDVPEPPEEAITKPGDLWLLGGVGGMDGHRLLCGDSTNPAHVDRLMDGHTAALVATDPPYLVDYTGERPNDSGKDWTATYKEVEITDADRFFRGVFNNVLRVIAPHAAIYCWHAHKRQRLIADIWHELGILDHQQVVWVKPTPVFGRVFWHFRHEPCMMGWRQGSQPVHDSNHEFNSVWEIDWEGKARIVGNKHTARSKLPHAPHARGTPTRPLPHRRPSRIPRHRLRPRHPRAPLRLATLLRQASPLSSFSMCLVIPDDILRKAGISDRDALIELACRLFDAQRLDKTAASRLCSLSRAEFEEELHRRGLTVFRTTAADYEHDRKSIDQGPTRKAG